MKQKIYSRYQYFVGNVPPSEIFEEYDNMFCAEYNEHGTQISGVNVAIAVDEAILLVYSLEAEAFLKLKFSNRKDVKINRYYRENHG